MAALYTIVICEILIPDKSPDVMYVNFMEESVHIPEVDNNSIIQYLQEKYKYPSGTLIKIKDILVLNSKEEFQKYIQ
jgi:hypothetical protein